MRPKLNQLWALTSHSPSALSRRMACIFRLEQQRTSDTSRPTSPARAQAKTLAKIPQLYSAQSLSLPLISCHHQIALPQARAPLHRRRRRRRLGRSGRPTPTKECPPRPLPSSTTAVRYPPSSPPPSRVASPRAPAARVRAARRGAVHF